MLYAMLYAMLRAVAAIALRWYYADVVVQGAERAPRDRPLLVVANHPNALVDPLLVGTTLHRRVLLTAKATLFEQPAVGALLRAVGVIPLRRASDERRAGGSTTPERNVHAFERVSAALRRGGCVLVFPATVLSTDTRHSSEKTGRRSRSPDVGRRVQDSVHETVWTSPVLSVTSGCGPRRSAPPGPSAWPP